MTKLYAMDLHGYEHGRWQALLPMERRKRIDACRNEQDKLRLAGAGYLLQRALLLEGIAAKDQIFEKNQWGKPYLKHHENIHFSLSHSGFWAVCAVSDKLVGVDIEQMRSICKIADRFFHPEELASAQSDDDLLRLWTAKEAYLKLLGRGLTVALNSFTVQLGEPPVLKGLPYALHEYKLDDYRVCLCSADTKPKLIIT